MKTQNETNINRDPVSEPLLVTNEFLPGKYITDTEIFDGETVPTVVGMVTALRSEIAALDERPKGLEADDPTSLLAKQDLIEDLYSISREIGDRAISKAGGHMSPRKALDLTRHLARPAIIKWVPDDALPPSSIADHNTQDGGRIRMRRSTIEPTSSHQLKDLEARGVTLRHPDDLRLIKAVRVMAHESGHAVLSGISLAFTPPGEDDDLRASEIYIGQHPEVAVTGDHYTDASIQEERFAEGVGLMVANETITALGYTEEEKALLLDMQSTYVYVGGEAGANQIDYIAKGLGTLALGDEEAVPSELKDKYAGLLGYYRPLQPTEIVDELTELSGLAESWIAQKDHGQDWTEAVKQHQDKPTKEFTDRLVGFRQDYHRRVVKHERRQTLKQRAKYLASAAAVVAVASMTASDTVDDSVSNPVPLQTTHSVGHNAEQAPRFGVSTLHVVTDETEQPPSR